jgi:hypothetical protein
MLGITTETVYVIRLVRVWSIKTAYREILLGENFKILSRFARRLGHICVHKVPPEYAVFMLHALTLAS